MFGKTRKLLRDGTPARAVVIESHRTGGHLTADGGASPVVYHLVLRIHLPDGSTVDTPCQVGGLTHSAHTYFSVGDIIPVRHAPTDPTQAVVDEPALAAEREARHREAESQAVARAERTLAGLPPLPDREPPTDKAMRTAYERWQTAAERAKEARTAHKQAERDGSGADKGTVLRAFNEKVRRGAEEKTARERYDELRKERPDWGPDQVG